MNILIAKTIVQSFINEKDIVLRENDALGNYTHIWNIADSGGEEEILECLTAISDLRMIHIFENKEG